MTSAWTPIRSLLTRDVSSGVRGGYVLWASACNAQNVTTDNQSHGKCFSSSSRASPVHALLWVFVLGAMLLSGCASRPINEPIAKVNPQAGYRPYLLIPKRQNNDQETLFVLSFSGGGTRQRRSRTAY